MRDEILKAVKSSSKAGSNVFASILLSDDDKTNKNNNPSVSDLFNNKVLDFDQLLNKKESLSIPDIEKLPDKDKTFLEGITDTALINTELSIYEKYRSLCPCSEAGFEDVSYYQKKKFDLAIENAGGEGNLAYVMIEITGIFDYIFNFRQNDTGTLKRMRARSYICLLISRAISLYLLNELKLPKCNVLDDGGELFGILFNKNAIQTVKEKIKLIKEELIRTFDGNINLLYVINENVSINELTGDSRKFMTALFEGLYEDEFHQFNDMCDMLSDETFRKSSHPQTCDYCGRDFAPLDGHKKNECSLCRDELKIGRNIPKAKYIISFVSDYEDLLNKANISFFSKIGFIFCRDEDMAKDEVAKIKRASYIDIASVNSTKFIGKIPCMEQVSYSFITINNAAPLFEHKIMDFNQMKDKATGAQYLSAMKMDVDNFGKVTGAGFGDKTSLLRIATISAYFKYFFQGYLTNIIEKNNGYTVYSGGDDLFLIAPWDKMIDLSVTINNEFQRFTGNNEFLSLSGGIATFTGTIPIRRIGKLAGEEESKAKNHEHNDKTKKNSAAVFGKVYKWDEIKEMRAFIDSNIIDSTGSAYREPFGNSLIYELHSLTKNMEKNDITAIPKIFYRMRDKSDLLKKNKLIGLDLYDCLIDPQKNKNKDGKNDFRYFHFIASYSALITRKRGEEY